MLFGSFLPFGTRDTANCRHIGEVKFAQLFPISTLCVWLTAACFCLCTGFVELPLHQDALDVHSYPGFVIVREKARNSTLRPLASVRSMVLSEPRNRSLAVYYTDGTTFQAVQRHGSVERCCLSNIEHGARMGAKLAMEYSTVRLIDILARRLVQVSVEVSNRSIRLQRPNRFLPMSICLPSEIVVAGHQLSYYVPSSLQTPAGRLVYFSGSLKL